MKFYFYILLLFPSLVLTQNSFLQAESYFQKEKFIEAKPLFQSYLKENPNHKITQEYLGDIAGYTNDWNTAIVYYSKLVENDETNANYHFKYGAALGMKAMAINRLRALMYIGDIKEALQKAVVLDPDHIEARWALVEFYIQLPGLVGGSERKAIKYAEELGNISPVDGYLSNGYIAEYSNRSSDAERFYKRAIEVGGSAHTYEKLSNFYEHNNKPREAIATSTKSLKIHKRNQLNYQIGKIAALYNVEAKVGLTCLHQYIKNYSIKDGVPLDWAYYRIAQIHKNQGNKQSALRWIDKALKNRIDFKEALKEREIINAL